MLHKSISDTYHLINNKIKYGFPIRQLSLGQSRHHRQAVAGNWCRLVTPKTPESRRAVDGWAAP